MSEFNIRSDVRRDKYIGKCPGCDRVRLELFVDGPETDTDVPRAVGIRCEKCGREWLLDPDKADFYGDYAENDPLFPRPPDNNPFGGDDVRKAIG